MLPGPTARLRLRPWTQSDRLQFREMNVDRRVMEYFPAPLSAAESDAFADRISEHQEKHGFSLWAVELRSTSTFIGFTGLAVPRWELPFTPCVEIGWRLARHSWGQGYATEAAKAALAFGFDELVLEEVVSFTAEINNRSRRVMERLGMQHCESEDFCHPALPPAHPLAKHVLYRLTREAWKKTEVGK
ncbi:N-acetyltransferase [Dyella sp. M7H15-1]|nr:N-acetyltransferase [Dyella sp. M7H15-1]